ncbi:MAG: hypothetical protein J7M38_14915 [Armatimonadetes bacterium]|nr:hypothetical protein [Armatimonadota bacterium]
MRISSRAFINHLSANLSRVTDDIARLSLQVSSGRRLTRPSDEPLAAARIVNARADLARMTNRLKTLDKAGRLISAADVALDTITDRLRHARELCMTATRPGMETSTRAAVAVELRSIARTIADEGNASIAGDYVFAGRKNRTEPLAEAGGTMTYLGSSEGMRIWVAPGRSMEVTVPGDRLFNFEDADGRRAVPEVESDIFTLIEDIAAAVEAGDDTAVEEMTPQLEALSNHIIEMRGVLGARAARIDSARTAAADAETHARQILADTEGVDLVEAIVELENQKLAYQSALAATAKMASLPTLFELQW